MLNLPGQFGRGGGERGGKLGVVGSRVAQLMLTGRMDGTGLPRPPAHSPTRHTVPKGVGGGEVDGGGKSYDVVQRTRSERRKTVRREETVWRRERG